MRLRILRLGDTGIYLHAGTLAFAVYMMLLGHGGLLLTGMVSILLHEGAHAVIATASGHAPREVELTPLGAVMRMDEEDGLPRAWRLAIIAAGPAMTLALCAVALLLTRAGWLPLTAGRILFRCNVALLALNLLPVLPLDGGRLVSLLLDCWLRPQRVRDVMRALNTVVGLLCIGLNLWVTWRYGGWNLSLAAAGCFMLYAGAVSATTTAMYELRGFMDRKIRMEQRRYSHAWCVSVAPDMPLRQAVKLLHPRRHTLFCLLEGGQAAARLMPEERVIDAYLRTPGASVGNAADLPVDR
ncbi:MAG: site-2 protease family protein [Aristaeellaceae bacterium]